MAFFAPRASLTAFSFLLGRRIEAQEWYCSDRTVETSHVACNDSAQASLCCQYGAICLTSGLCFDKGDTSINIGTCTDKTWTDPSCFQDCPYSTGIEHGFNTLYRCNGNQWCCSTIGNTTSCCDDCDVKLFRLEEVGAAMEENWFPDWIHDCASGTFTDMSDHSSYESGDDIVKPLFRLEYSCCKSRYLLRHSRP